MITQPIDPTLSPKKGAGDIFIVDDNPNNLSLLTTMLREAGHQVRLANAGRRALTAVAAHPPELIMLDINMPDLDGYAVCAELKANPATRDIPVIFLSALDDIQDKLSAFRAGGVDYVTKPFQTEEVLARVENQLNLARLRTALEAKNRELARKNEELQRAWQNNQQIFSTLSEILAGTKLDGKYRLDAKIGTGGFAAVYRGRHLGLERDVAIKVLRPDLEGDPERQLERFRREGVHATQVQHPNAVAVLDSGLTASGIAYLVMELLEGRSLAEELNTVGRLPPARCAAIMMPVCAVLAEAHGAGIVHRDIKPSNIFLHAEGGRETVKVVDFGIAKPFEAAPEGGHLTTLGRLIGTPVYMSPERLLGHEYDGRADSYSVGVTLYEMLAGHPPFGTPDMGLGKLIMTCLTHEPAPLRDAGVDCPEALADVVMRALAKRPEHRPGVLELAAVLASCADKTACPPGQDAGAEDYQARLRLFDLPTLDIKNR